MTTIEPPEPGIYKDTPMREYHAWDAASNSRLSRLMRSPAHLRTYIEDDYTESKAQRIGRMIHMAVLEPELFEENYTVLGDCEAIKKSDNKPCTNSARVERDGEQYCGTHDPGGPDPDTEFVSEDELETAERIRERVREKESCQKLLAGAGDVEVSVVWEDPETGVTCKARWDRYAPAASCIVDLKTTKNAEFYSFRKDIFRYGYHRQAHFYLRGALALDYDVSGFGIIAAEKEPPYGVAPYTLPETVVHEDDIEDQVNRLLRLYAKCTEADHWPDYPDRVADISIPSWGWKQIERQNSEIARMTDWIENGES